MNAPIATKTPQPGSLHRLVRPFLRENTAMWRERQDIRFALEALKDGASEALLCLEGDSTQRQPLQASAALAEMECEIAKLWPNDQALPTGWGEGDSRMKPKLKRPTLLAAAHGWASGWIHIYELWLAEHRHLLRKDEVPFERANFANWLAACERYSVEQLKNGIAMLEQNIRSAGSESLYAKSRRHYLAAACEKTPNDRTERPMR